MLYEDMLHEQENQTWFQFEDEMDACDITVSIRESDAGNFPDCVGIEHERDIVAAIAPLDAIHLYFWLGHHLERLKEAQAQRYAEYNEMPLEVARKSVDAHVAQVREENA